MSTARPASPWHDAAIAGIEAITPRIVSVRLQAPLAVQPVAGQHVEVRLTAEDGYSAQRSYSIASASSAPHIELIIEKLDDGEVSPYFHEVAQAGDTLELRGPLGGHFIWRPHDGVVEIALQSSTRDAHRLAPTPLVALCTSVEPESCTPCAVDPAGEPQKRQISHPRDASGQPLLFRNDVVAAHVLPARTRVAVEEGEPFALTSGLG